MGDDANPVPLAAVATDRKGGVWGFRTVEESRVWLRENADDFESIYTAGAYARRVREFLGEEARNDPSPAPSEPTR